MSTKSEIISELLSIKVKRIKNPCKNCFVKSACIIFKCSFILNHIKRYPPNQILLNIYELVQIINIVHDVKFDFSGIIDQATKCPPHNLFILKHNIRGIQKDLNNGIAFPKKQLEFLLKEYKETIESTQN